MIIYRIEQKNGGYGPFTSSTINMMYMTDFEHPYPTSDGIPFQIGCGLIFGCPDWESLKHWFYNSNYWYLCRENINDMAKDDFVINVYTIPDDHVHLGNSKSQVAFFRELSTKLAVIAVSNLIDPEFEPNF